MKAEPAFKAMLSLSFVAILASGAQATEPQVPGANCGGLADAAGVLKAKWGEELIGRGLMQTGNALAFCTDATGDTFTVLVVFPDGTACVAASGTGWEILPPYGETPSGQLSRSSLDTSSAPSPGPAADGPR